MDTTNTTITDELAGGTMIKRETGWGPGLADALGEKNRAEVLTENATTGRMFGQMTPVFEPGLHFMEHRPDIQVQIQTNGDEITISITCATPLTAWQALRHVLAGVPLTPTTTKIKTIPTLVVTIR